MPILFGPQPVTGRLRIFTSGALFDLTAYVQDRQDISAEWDTAAAQGSCTIKLTMRVQDDIYHLEAWDTIYWDSPPVGGGTIDRHFRGFIATLGSETHDGKKIYTLKVVDGNVLLDHPYTCYETPTTFDFQTATTDKQIVTAILTHCFPVGTPDRVYDTAVNAHYTFYHTPPLTFMGMNARQALAHLQEYIAGNTPADSEIPTAWVTWTRDDPPTHSDNWAWLLEWYTQAEIGTAAIGLSDQLSEDATHAHYYGFKRQRNGGQVVNRQVAIGKDPVTHEPITYTADDTTSQTYFGRIISGKPILNDQLTTYAQVQAAAHAELEKWRDVQETLNVGPVFIPYLLTAPQKVTIQRANEGGISTPTPYALARVTLAYNSAGTPEYQLELGTSFPELGERGPGWRGGTSYNTGRTQPAIPVWHPVPADDVLQNAYRGQSRSVTAELTWVPNPEDNLLDYYVQWQLDSGAIVQVRTTVPQSGQPSYPVTDLPPSVTGGATHTLTMRVRARNTWGYVSSDWSAWRTPLTLPGADAPDPPTLAFGQDVYQRFGSAYFTGTLTPPSGLPDHYHLYYYRNGGTWQRDILDPGTTGFKIKADIGVQYLVYVKSATRYGDEGLPSNTIVHTVPADPRDNPEGPGGFDSQAADAITPTNPGFVGWPTLSGTGAVSRDTGVTASGAASAAQALTAGQGSTLTSTPFPVKDEAVVVLRLLAQRTATTITPGLTVDTWDAAGTALTPVTPTLPTVAVGGWTAITLKLDLPAGAVRAAITLSATDGGISGTQTLYWAWGGWDVRREDIDLGVITTAAKIAPYTDDATRQQGYNAAAAEAAWEIFRSSAQKIVFAALNEATAGPNALRLQDAYGNAADLGSAGIELDSIAQIVLNGMVSLAATHTSTNLTLDAHHASVVADVTGSDVVLTLPLLATVPDGLYLIRVYYNPISYTGGVCTLQPQTGEKINRTTTIDLLPDAMVWVLADTTGWWTLAGGGGGGGATAFTGLTDTFPSYSGYGGMPLYVKSDETGITTVPGPTTGGDIRAWALGEAYQLLSITYDGTYTTVIASASVLWPDGSTGTFTTDTINTTWLGVDAYSITHDDTSLTATQTAITRNSDGAPTTVPALTVA